MRYVTPLRTAKCVLHRLYVLNIRTFAHAHPDAFEMGGRLSQPPRRKVCACLRARVHGGAHATVSVDNRSACCLAGRATNAAAGDSRPPILVRIGVLMSESPEYNCGNPV